MAKDDVQKKGEHKEKLTGNVGRRRRSVDEKNRFGIVTEFLLFRKHDCMAVRDEFCHMIGL